MGGDRARYVHRAEQVDLELTPHRGIGEGLEEAQFGIAGIVDQHVDRTEPLGTLGGDRVRRLGVGDIEREGVQAIMFAPAGIAHRVGGSRRCHDRFTCIERRARDLASQPPARARHQPDLAHRLLLVTSAVTG
nr:hypothetical protein [Xanthomonas arboricola]MDN0204566.1 hypothetical protein [Xanthomonas arboricola pv. corylina]MDN0216749.1 hypothetical protein [Xanthomonas arboricola pv. corylina]